MSNPYTIRDPYHSSQYVTLKRPAKCKGCTTGEFPEERDSPLEKGQKVIKVTIGCGPSTRNQHFHEECYFRIRNVVMAAFLCDAWKVQPDNGQLSLVGQDTKKEEWNKAFESYAADNLQYIDDIPF